jgi:hypothetical protein
MTLMMRSMLKSDHLYWDENGERMIVPLSSSDAGINDMPRIMRENRDLRHALHKSVDMLNQLGYQPTDPASARAWEFINLTKKRNIL